MSVEALAVVLHHSRAKGTAKLVLVGVANHEGDGGAWPTVATLARYANVDVRTAQRALVKLQQLGELDVEGQAGGLAGTADCDRPNLYHVKVRCPTWCDGTPQHRDQRRLAGHQVGWRPGPVGVTLGHVSVTPLSTAVDNGVTPTSPPGVAVTPPGDTGVTPPGDVGATRTIPGNTPSQPRGTATVSEGASPTAQLQARAAALPPCHDCGQAAARCLAIPASTYGHVYAQPPERVRARGWTHQDHG